MKKRDFKFTVSSKFALFHWDIFKSDYRVSNLFVSRTEVMGIIGSILGLDGYQAINIKTYKQFSFEPKEKSRFKKEKFTPEYDPSTSFWEILKGVKVAIKPLFHPAYAEDFLVHRDTYRINSRGNLTVQLQMLRQPSYEIFIKGDSIENDAIYEKLTHYLENHLAEFLPYLGKNGYRCDIDNFEFVDLKPLEDISSEGEVICISSIHPTRNVIDIEKLGISAVEAKEWEYPNQTYTYIDEVKIGYGENTEILREEAVWSNKECSLKEMANFYQDVNGENLYFY